jgi:uncharacterized protein YjbI with pentapeptide repeats
MMVAPLTENWRTVWRTVAQRRIIWMEAWSAHRLSCAGLRQRRPLDNDIRPVGVFFVLFDTRRAFIMTVTSSQDLLEGYASGERDFAYADLHGDDLWGSELQGVDLEGADLGGADLRRVDLARASLRGANLSHSLLTGASLRGADLRDANLNGAILYGVDLTHARLEGADLAGAVRYDPELSRRRRVESVEEPALVR